MNTLLRRFFILAAVLLCCTATANAYDAQIDGIYYNLDEENGTATVTSGDSKYEGDITIPAKVTYESKEYIVTSIGAAAFYENYALASITIPSGVTSIGASAFYWCSNLASITIPSGVTSIGDSTFYNCSKLATVTFAEGSKLESIGAAAFYKNYALESITIPSSVTSIGDNAFNDCRNLASVTFEEGSKLESIGAAAFYQNYALTSITIPSSVTSIGASAFYENYALASITIPSSVTSIGDNAFNDCRNLASVTFEEGSKLESIGAAAFYQNYALESITIPNSVTSIGLGVFNGCSKLQKVYINIVNFAKDNVIYNYFGSDKTIKYYYNGSEISGEFVIPETTTSIGKNLLQGCTGLTSITIPSSVTSIGERAFSECSGLESITVQWTEVEKIPDISGKEVFEGITQSDVMLHVPLATKTLYKGTNVWKEFKLNEEIGILIVKADDSRIKQKFPDVSDFSIDESNNDIKNIVVPDDVDAVSSITYTRDFTNVAGKWQAWFVPFEAPVSVLNEASIDVAEIAGILLDDEGETIVAFKKIEGDSKKMHANTPYVVRMGNDATTIATLVFENTNLKETAESEYYAMSMYDIFTFTGNYESKAVANSYALNTEGEFQKMANDAVLGPMRFSLSVTPRDDSPYADETPNSSPRPAIRYMILGDDSSLQPIDGDLQQGGQESTLRAMTPAISLKPRPQQTFIYDLHGRKVNRIQSKQVYIINGKNYIAR